MRTTGRLVALPMTSLALREMAPDIALLEGTVQRLDRSEGEATVHPASLLHGVSRIRGGVRYSLIVFYEALDLAKGGEW